MANGIGRNGDAWGISEPVASDRDAGGMVTLHFTAGGTVNTDDLLIVVNGFGPC